MTSAFSWGNSINFCLAHSILQGKFGLGVQIEASQRLTDICQDNTLVIANVF